MAITYALALVLLFVFTHPFWVILIFPAWVLMVGVYILITRLAGGRGRETAKLWPRRIERRLVLPRAWTLVVSRGHTAGQAG